MTALSDVTLAAVVLLAAAVIAGAGTWLARVADRLADLTHLGEALFGAVLLGAATSMPGVVTTVVAAAEGHPALAVSNAVGGIAAQTFFLALADVAYPRANLEHASASLANLVQGALLIALLAIPMIVGEVELGADMPVHPATGLLLVAYLLGIRLANQARKDPLWRPTRTTETRPDIPDPMTIRSGGLRVQVMQFVALALVVGAAGYVVAEAGIEVSGRTGLSETVVGSLLTAIITSLPELVTTVAAARHGAPTLAVSDIIGGNSFDVLFLACADVAFSGGSIYHTLTADHRLYMLVSMLMTAILLLGMLRRERHGIANIGFESVLLIVVYVGTAGYVVWSG